jgi:6-phosphogluconolactonase
MQSVPHGRESSMHQAPTNGAVSGAVYVQTNAAPNEEITFRQADDGSLDRIGSVATGGEGDGSPHLQSQGSVALTRDGRHLLMTNSASDDLSVYSVAADGSIEVLDRVHTGATPRSVAEREGLVVVLNTGEPGLASFRLQVRGSYRWRAANRRSPKAPPTPRRSGSTPTGRWS